MAAEIHVGDTGTVFRATCVNEQGTAEDVSTAQSVEFVFRRSDGTTFTKSATLTNGGTDGVVHYTTQAEDLNMSGKWRYQVYVNTADGPWHTNIVKFEVVANLT